MAHPVRPAFNDTRKLEAAATHAGSQHLAAFAPPFTIENTFGHVVPTKTKGSLRT